MDGEPSTAQSPTSEKKKRLRDLNNNGDLLVNRGKPVSEKWKPVWMWLQSLGRTKIVDSAEVTAWLESNPDYAGAMKQFHSHGVLVHYVQKCHQRLVHGRNYKGEGRKVRMLEQPPVVKIPRERRLTNEIRLPNGRFGTKATTESSDERQEHYQLRWSEQLAQNLIPSGKPAKWDLDKTEEASILDAETWRDQWRMLLDSEKRNAEVDSSAELKVEKTNGTGQYSKRIKRPRSVYSPERFDRPMPSSKEKVTRSVTLDKVDALTKFELILSLEMRLKETLSRYEGPNYDAHDTSIGDKVNQGGGGTSQGGSDSHMHAWAFSDASLVSRVHEGVTAETKLGVPSIVESLKEREQGANSGTAAYRPKEVGSRGKRWTNILKGWDSLGKQKIRALKVVANERIFLLDAKLQGIQKVLDVRFHPGGDPLLAVSCNEPPHELLLYNLDNGRGKELIGHNTQIQAVEFALGGDAVLSCASNIVKVWESSSGICLHTLGPGSQDGLPGHTKKISAMAVNELLPCLAATSGGEGDNQLLLWNVSTGELASDLNANHRHGQTDLPSMDALKFSNEKYLICGSDSPGGNPAIVQIWDIDALTNLVTFPAHDSFVTCLDTTASGSSVITGSGDGSINLFDVRSGGNIVRLPLSSTWEVTSVSFSTCETFFQASCTGNCTFIWDTRMMPLKAGARCFTEPAPLSTEHSFRALHLLSHGAPMPTADNAFQVPGYVDVGDQGVNDARWFQNEALLVTGSGNGRVTIWDPSLGQPCLRQISSHSRCINTVAISPKDQFICTGGDDQKVVSFDTLACCLLCGLDTDSRQTCMTCVLTDDSFNWKSLLSSTSLKRNAV